MTNQEAKFILGVYRPSGADAGNATFGVALEHAKTDPALGAWFARDQAHAAAITAKLREIAPPAGLREAILAGGRLSAVPEQNRRSRLPAWLALAASVAVLATIGIKLWPNRAAAEEQRLALFAIDDAAHGRHGGHGTAAGALQSMLSLASTRLGGDLPVDFAALQSTGCRTLRVEGHDMIEVCFVRDGSEYHLYVVQRSDFPELPAKDGPIFTDREGMTVASWSDNQRHYIVASGKGRSALEHLL